MYELSSFLISIYDAIIMIFQSKFTFLIIFIKKMNIF
jgi:hypothetical protein